MKSRITAMARSGASGIASNKETVRTERGAEQRRNDVAVNGIS
jgi:hypothetical protein